MAKTLALVMAAGEGKRIKPLLEEDEPLKPLIKVESLRLIDFVLGIAREQIRGNDKEIDARVLTYPSSKYDALDDYVKEMGFQTLKQKAPHVSDSLIPSSLQPFYILFWQYLFPQDSYLRGFDSIMTFPADHLWRDVNFAEMIEFHNQGLGQNEKRLTLLSRKYERGDEQQRKIELFRLDKDRIRGYKKWEGEIPEGYERYISPPQVYILSRELLAHPFSFFSAFLSNFRIGNVRAYLYETQGNWVDAGTPEILQQIRQERLRF